MPILAKSAILLAKIQPAANTDALPTGALNSMMVGNLSVQPVTAEFSKRNNIKPYLGNMGSVSVAIHSEISFEIEMAGSGVAGTAPKYAPILRACAMAETLVASTSAAYSPITNGQEAVTMYYNVGGLLFKITDAKGSVAYSLNAKGIPVLKFKFFGLYSTPTDTPTPAGVDYSGFKDPVAVNYLNTPVCTLHGVAGKVQSLEIDMANQLSYRNLIGGESIVITDRQPSGSIVMELDLVAVKDWWSIIKNGVTGPLAVTHGLVAGNISQWAAPKVQVLEPSFSESDGIVMLTCKLDFLPNVGNDEFIFTTK